MKGRGGVGIRKRGEVESLRIGARIRNLRKERGYTLATVARGTGLSAGLLSLVENEQVTPPISTLLKIARFFGVTMSRFFEEKSPGSISVIRRGERKPISRRLSKDGRPIGYEYFSLGYKKADKMIEPFYVEFDPKKRDEVLYFDHEGEEFLYVLSGRLEFNTIDQSTILRPGDALMFDSSVPHGFRSAGPGRASAVVTVVEKRA